jgi:hypothetical protein
MNHPESLVFSFAPSLMEVARWWIVLDMMGFPIESDACVLNHSRGYDLAAAADAVIQKGMMLYALGQASVKYRIRRPGWVLAPKSYR